MVAEMVVAVADDDVKGHTTVELSQIPLHFAAVLKDEVYDV